MLRDDQNLRKHKNIVKYIHSIRTDTHLNIVLEYVEGLEFEGIGGFNQVCWLLSQLCWIVKTCQNIQMISNVKFDSCFLLYSHVSMYLVSLLNFLGKNVH